MGSEEEVITTDEFRKLLPTALADVEHRIDASLVEAANSGAPGITFACSLIPPNFLRSVAHRYEDAGWSVTYVSDPRDGDYLEIELP